MIWILIAYWFHQSMIDAVTGAREVSRAEEPRLYNLLENLCISRGITMPKLRIADDDALNAFATGLNDKQYSITVTRGLIDALNDEEIEVRARPRAHPHPQRRRAHDGDRRRDRRRDLVLRRDDLPAVLPERVLWRTARAAASGERKGGAGLAIVIALALIVVAWVLSIVIRFALSRQREFLADAGSVELTKNPDGMISALRKIEGRGELHAANSAVMEMCIDNPREGFADIFATHPSVDARVEALVKFAGGHDPGPLALPGPEDAVASQPPPGGPWGGDAAQQAAAPQDRGLRNRARMRPPMVARGDRSKTNLSCPAKAGHPVLRRVAVKLQRCNYWIIRFRG